MDYLDQPFFERPPDEVARDLVGGFLTVRSGDETVTVRLVETEAYGGSEDAASHAFRGRTARNGTMFGPPGRLYVYRIYGIHWCANVVTLEVNQASAVLLRAAEFVASTSELAQLRAPASMRGPGNLTRALGITGDDDGRDCCEAGARITLRSTAGTRRAVARSARIGLTKEAERMSRYYLVDNDAVTKVARALSSG